VFLAGGSTLLPGLRSYVSQYFGKRPRYDLDPMQVVSLGASLAAARPAVSELLDPCA
jgi:molecular chaperone DnaK (HSP70)